MNADGGAMRMEKSSVTGPPRGSQVSAPLGALPSPLTPGAPDRAQAPSTSRCSEALVPTPPSLMRGPGWGGVGSVVHRLGLGSS